MPNIRPFGAKAAKFIRRPPELDARINILTGSVSSAKTWSMIPKFFDLCSYKVGGIGLITGVSKQTIKTNVLNDIFDLIPKRAYTYNSQTGELNICGDRWIVMGAKDEGSEKFIRGATVGKWYADELTKTPKSFTDMAMSRLRRPGARMYATTNPDNPFHYVKTDYIDRMDLRAEGKINVVEYRLEDNPNLDEEYLDTVRKLYKGVFKLRFIDGLWVMAHGSVFRDVWDESKILYSAKDEPIGLRGSGGYQRRWITVDYGTGNPTCFLDWYDDGKYYWLVNEYYWDSKKEARQKTDSEYASDLIEWMHKGGRPGCEVIVDPSAASFKLELQRRGVWVKNAKNDVLDGIRLTSTMLGNGIIRVNRDACPMVLKEMPNYSWDPNAAKLGEDKPIKANDHSCDPFRYACATVFDQYRRAA